VTDPDNPFAVTLLLDRAVDIVSAAADGQRLRAAAMIAASRINPVPATRTADPAMAAIEEEYRRRLDDLETPRTPVPNGSGEDIEEIPLGECGSVTAEIDENGPTTGDVRAFRIRCDLRGIAMGRTIAVISTPDGLPAALVAEGLRRAGLPDEFALRLNVVTVLQPFGPPIIRLRFPLDVASIDLPVLTREARETLAPMTRPTLRVKIDGGFDEGLVVRELSLPPEPVDRSVEPMQALRATRVLAGLDVPAEIITENAVSVLRHLSRTRP
jgi:hypothetical protein